MCSRIVNYEVTLLPVWYSKLPENGAVDAKWRIQIRKRVISFLDDGVSSTVAAFLA